MCGTTQLYAAKKASLNLSEAAGAGDGSDSDSGQETQTAQGPAAPVGVEAGDGGSGRAADDAGASDASVATQPSARTRQFEAALLSRS